MALDEVVPIHYHQSCAADRLLETTWLRKGGQCLKSGAVQKSIILVPFYVMSSSQTKVPLQQQAIGQHHTTVTFDDGPYTLLSRKVTEFVQERAR